MTANQKEDKMKYAVLTLVLIFAVTSFTVPVLAGRFYTEGPIYLGILAQEYRYALNPESVNYPFSLILSIKKGHEYYPFQISCTRTTLWDLGNLKIGKPVWYVKTVLPGSGFSSDNLYQFLDHEPAKGEYEGPIRKWRENLKD